MNHCFSRNAACFLFQTQPNKFLFLIQLLQSGPLFWGKLLLLKKKRRIYFLEESQKRTCSWTNKSQKPISFRKSNEIITDFQAERREHLRNKVHKEAESPRASKQKPKRYNNDWLDSSFKTGAWCKVNTKSFKNNVFWLNIHKVSR